MKNYFEQFELLKDSNNPFSMLYKTPKGDMFYLEPVFITKLDMMINHNLKDKDVILSAILNVVEKNHKVVFTGNFEFPQTEAEGFIFLEIEDVTNPLQIYVEDKSRGSDYGD